MKAQDINNFIYANVKDTKNNCEVQIIGYSAGWVEVEHTGTMEVYKLRAKDLEIITGVSDAEVDEDTKEIRENAPSFDDTKSESKVDDSDTWEVTCPSCDHSWETAKTENYRCPKCGHCFVVRLHPDKERYVKGLSLTATGRDTFDIDDYVAGLLRGLDIDSLYEKVVEVLLGISPTCWFSKATDSAYQQSGLTLDDFLGERYSHLNPGMQRMNLGNLLRGALKRAAADGQE